MKKIFLFLVASVCLACSDNKKSITHFQDYEVYLSYNHLVSNDPFKEELKFWNERLYKNSNDEVSLIKLGTLHAALFKSTGLVDHILLSDSLYHEVLKKYPKGNVEIYHSLSANAISQHKFQNAKNYTEKALNLKDKKATSLLQLVDVSLEIGDYARANQILREFTNINSFAYLIRKAKVEDHEGMLDSAIVCMEKAYQRVKGNKALAQWALSNLGDMYGHAGKIEQAYAAYLEVLKNNPNDDYALKGIAWISISHDQNTVGAKRIINTLAVRKFMPEAHIMLAEIAELEGNEMEKLIQLKKFKSLVSGPAYKTLYHKYLATLEAEEFDNPNVAIAIAKDEITNRPTPLSYDLLAWAYYHQKNFKAALEIATSQVENQTFEPEALYHLGMIYHASGNKENARHYLLEALQSQFELGPSTAAKIKTAIQNL